MNYFIHYDVLDPRENGNAVKRLVSGPYTMDEAIIKRQELANGSAINAHIEEEIK